MGYIDEIFIFFDTRRKLNACGGTPIPGKMLNFGEISVSYLKMLVPRGFSSNFNMVFDLDVSK